MKHFLTLLFVVIISTPAFAFDYDVIMGPNIPPNPYQTTQEQKVDMGPYIRHMQQEVRSAWKPSEEDKTKQVVLTFTLHQDGNIEDVKILKTSGSRSADQTAMFAVALASPFGQLPKGCKKKLHIQFTFDKDVFSTTYR